MIRSLGIGRRTAAVLTGLLMIGALVTVLSGSAQASVPNRWGFAFVSAPAVAGIPPASHQAGNWPPAFKVHTTPGAPGQVVVRFPQIGVKGGVVHVTAVTPSAAWCQAQQWSRSGADEIVVVRCYQHTGAPVFVPFVVVFTQSSKAPFPAGRAYGYVRYQPGPGILTSFNSAGGSVTVTHLGTGVWVVRLFGLGSAALTGNVQLTPVNPAAPAKCQVADWASVKANQAIEVRCYHVGTALMNTGWTLSYQRGRAIMGTQPKAFAYTFDNKPAVAGPYAPAPPALNFNSAGGVNTIVRSGTGLRLVTFPRVGRLPNTVLVTAFQATPGGFCNLISPWATTGPPRNVIVRDVGCYTAAGAPASRPSLITYSASR